ncbi:BTAD domain-containing putative transcriptional regulator [Longispora sp. K20-0274]|uniref:AfsR/SARP family transcriptional regulator n=1 Tax=Longispora sp. K20-0274 TaxID=3088255 RepID=UPI00399B9FB5
MEFRVLGEVAVLVDTVPVDLGLRRMERCLLGLLALEVGTVVPVERLADLLWNAEPPDRYRSQIQVLVSRLRARFARYEDFELRTVAPGYLLAGLPDQVDALRFRALCRAAGAADTGAGRLARVRIALDLWRGDVLADVATDAVRAWISPGYRELWLSAVELRIEAELDLGRHLDVLGELVALCVEHPTRERLAAARMLALYRAGRRDDALTAFAEIRRALAGTGPGSRLDTLHQRILRGDPTLDPPRVPERSQPPDHPAPAQLPPPVPDFTGRYEQLGQLDAWLDGGGPIVVTTISGVGGVGKTALALHWAHRIRAAFPDGQLYVNLHGYSPTPPIAPIVALTGFLRALGVAGERIPVSVDEAAALYRDVLADRRLLVILDNATSADQVRPLLPGGPACLALVTSRDLLTGLIARDGARRIAVDPLPTEQAVALLVHLLGPDRTAGAPVEALAVACGRLPLALRIAAANLADRTETTVAGYVEELRSAGALTALVVEGDPQSSVRATFQLSYQALEPGAARMFRLLGLVPGPDVTPGAAAALAGTDPGTATRLLDRLFAAHLVETAGPGRYALHDLLREFAHEQATGEERDAAVDRLYAHYLGTADAATRQLHPSTLRLPMPVPTVGDMDAEEAKAWLDAELANLTAAIAHAAEHGPYPMSWHLSDCLRDHFRARSRFPEWLAATRAALDAATAHGDARARANAHLGRGSACNNTGDPAAAVEEYLAGLEMARAADWRVGVPAILNNLGIIRTHTGRRDLAIDNLTEAVALNQALGARAGEAYSTSSLGTLLRYVRLRDARECLTRALGIFEELGYPAMAAMAHHNLALVHLDLGEPDTALDLATEALRRARAMGNRQVEDLALGSLTEARLERGDIAGARALAVEAVDRVRSGGNGRMEAGYLALLASVELAGGAGAGALGLCDTALDILSTTTDVVIEVRARLVRTRALRALGRFDEARAEADRALAPALGDGNRTAEAQARAELAAVLAASGDAGGAGEQARLALTARRETGYRRGDQGFLEELAGPES